MLRYVPDHYSKWDHIPWVAFRWPSEVWKDQPTFLFGEFLFIVGALIALAHAKHNGRLHVLAWISALVAGTANDAFFMWIPIVDNFWQAQASVMMCAPAPPALLPLPRGGAALPAFAACHQSLTALLPLLQVAPYAALHLLRLHQLHVLRHRRSVAPPPPRAGGGM